MNSRQFICSFKTFLTLLALLSGESGVSLADRAYGHYSMHRQLQDSSSSKTTELFFLSTLSLPPPPRPSSFTFLVSVGCCSILFEIISLGCI